MSSRPASRGIPASLLYGAAALIFGFEAAVVWLMLHPNVPDDFRAYYITHTTTCLNQPVTGDYEWGILIAVDSRAAGALKTIRVCGWEGPVGDGLHAVGTSARLRLVGTPDADETVLVAELAAVRKDGEVRPQRVNVLLDGDILANWQVTRDTPQRFTLALPAQAVADGRVELELAFPDAVQMGPTDPDTRWRSVKLSAIGIVAPS